jgi:hypothetical protein
MGRAQIALPRYPLASYPAELVVIRSCIDDD